MHHPSQSNRDLTRLELACEQFLLREMRHDAAHDLAHVRRVVVTAKLLAEEEGENPIPIVLAAWLHDIVNFAKNDPQRAEASQHAAIKAVAFLKTLHVDPSILDQVHHAIEAHSYSAQIPATTKIAQIVQDADRLDALGAIGVARCLLVGGQLQRRLYNETDPFCENRMPDDQHYVVDHFFKKLLNIAETLGTESARIEGQRRLSFMKQFLNQLSSEIAPSQ